MRHSRTFTNKKNPLTSMVSSSLLSNDSIGFIAVSLGMALGISSIDWDLIWPPKLKYLQYVSVMMPWIRDLIFYV